MVNVRRLFTICVALLALKTGWLDIAGSLPQGANDCFKTTISLGPVPAHGPVVVGGAAYGSGIEISSKNWRSESMRIS